jgi:hypothetical protein
MEPTDSQPPATPQPAGDDRPIEEPDNAALLASVQESLLNALVYVALTHACIDAIENLLVVVKRLTAAKG